MQTRIKAITVVVRASLLMLLAVPVQAQWTTSGTNIYNSNTGNVGVGTNAPAYKLHVVGGDTFLASRVLWIRSTAASDAWAFLFNDGTAGGAYYSANNTRPNAGYFVDATRRWYMGLWGDTTFRIQDFTTGTDRITVTTAGLITLNGNVTVNGNIAAKYQDVAEWVRTESDIAPGTVVVLDRTRRDQVLPSSSPYDTRVAGVVSSQPGLILGEEGEGKVKVATTGRVKIKVDAGNGGIEIGDLLVTSDRSGVAMKSTELDVGGVKLHRPGTIVAKALEPLEAGEGEILALLTLQ